MIPVDFRGSYSSRHLRRIAALSRRVHGGEPIYSGVGCFGAATILCVLTAISIFGDGKREEAWVWIGLAVLAAAITAWQWRGLRRALSQGANREMHGTISESGFRIVTPESDAQSAWTVAKSYVATDDMLLLLFDSTNAVTAFPREFFATETEFTHAVAFASANLQPERRSTYRRIFSLLTWIVVIIFIILLWKLFRETQHPPPRSKPRQSAAAKAVS